MNKPETANHLIQSITKAKKSGLSYSDWRATIDLGDQDLTEIYEACFPPTNQLKIKRMH